MDYDKTENEILQREIKDLKTCDDCDHRFDYKAEIKAHIQYKH